MKRKSPRLSRQRPRFLSDQINSKIKRAPPGRAPARICDFLSLLLRRCPLFIGKVAVAGSGLQVFITLSARFYPYLEISAIAAGIGRFISDAVLVAYVACNFLADFIDLGKVLGKEGHTCSLIG